MVWKDKVIWKHPGSCFAVLAAGGAPWDSFAVLHVLYMPATQGLVGNLRKGLHHVPQSRVSGCEWLRGGKIKLGFILEAIFWEQLRSISLNLVIIAAARGRKPKSKLSILLRCLTVNFHE